ncbi:MAG: hypothetical protein COS99_03285 [Candidatus Omnitrophica bacterium CG07_land_8_20_14_0_80_42_15]|uniref:Lipoprotein n=1 Tax=Candidatus Aquitaenariimonas noxiae TaxID=1974741 RepID=A0A2J0KVJ1_9BACT|nr:MAG: hypothetical protein COS99_03285 [Candidatus Omnitrophica bacterium CG07_land_8_20_14_0_80_42_15]
MKKILLLALVLLFTISGCGYTTKSLLAPHLRTVYIEPVINKIDFTRETTYDNRLSIYRPGLERDLTKTLKERFIFDGNLKVVNEKEKADSELMCEVVDFLKEPLQYTDDQNVDEYRLKIIVNIKFTDLSNNVVLVDEKSFAGESTYTITGTLAGTESGTEQNAITDLARRVVEKIIEGW